MPKERNDLCETLLKLCEQFGSREVSEALADVLDAVKKDTGEFDESEAAVF